MSQPLSPKPAKLVIGFILRERGVGIRVVRALVNKYGAVDMASSWLPFNFTTYYNEEMGSPLFRRLVAFKQLVHQDSLADIKLFTNDLEHELSMMGNRVVNIDPGYLLHERFVLATGKNYSHRIHVGKGIYADLTLMYTKGGFEPLPWTYPDYSSEHIMVFLKQVRKKYTIDLRKAGEPSG